KGVHQHGPDSKEDTDHGRTEDAFAPILGDSEEVEQVAVDVINEAVVIPRLPRPEPLPYEAANEGADENHGDPHDDEAEEKCSDGEFALLPGVGDRAQRIGIYIRNYHQAEDDEGGHDYTGDPGIEVNEHFLQAEEIPRRFRGVHGQVRVGRFYLPDMQGNGQDHMHDGVDYT